MKRSAVILLAVVVTFSVVAPRRLDAAINDDMVAQAMRCQSVLVYYSFFSALPLQILSQMNVIVPVPRAQDGTPASAADTSGSDAAPAPFDISIAGTPTFSQTPVPQTILEELDVIASRGILSCAGACLIRHHSAAGGWACVRHHWMVMLPRGSIDDYILKTIRGVNEPIGRYSQLAFSLGGNV